MRKLLGLLLTLLMVSGCGAAGGSSGTAPDDAMPQTPAAAPAPAPSDPYGSPAQTPSETQTPSEPDPEPQPPPDSGPQPPPDSDPQPPPDSPPDSPSDAVLEITVDMSDFRFEPDVITVPVGAQVRLTILNSGEKGHDLNIIGGPSVESNVLQSGQSQVLEFMAAQTGEFQIVCSQRGHKDKGMVGSLVIE